MKPDVPQIVLSSKAETSVELNVSSLEQLSEAMSYELMKPRQIKFYEVILITSEGSGDYSIDFTTYPYQKGSLIFIPKNGIHSFKKNVAKAGEVLQFTEAFLNDNIQNKITLSLHRLYNMTIYTPIIQTTTAEFNAFDALLKSIKTEYNYSNDFASKEILQGFLKLFLLKAERIIDRTDTKTASIYYDEFLNFQKLLQTNLFKERSVKAYANALFISTKKLNMITQEIIDLPAKTYITNTLILAIKRKLVNSNTSIKEIGYQVGFDEPTNFVKFFKKYQGVTPVKFREHNRS